MSTSLHKQDWDDLGEMDPLWAICSTPGLRQGKWNLDEFFETGRREIASVMAQAGELGLPRQRETALDFGCGVGRLTRALGDYFQTCYGLDISASMIERATQLHAARPNCHFLVNTANDLRRFDADTFDLVYTNLVLQHMESRAIIRGFIAEFVRVLKPGGLAVFQLPSHIPLRRRLEPRRRLYRVLRLVGVPPRFLYDRLGLHPMRMQFIPPSDIETLVHAQGGRVLDVQREPTPRYESATYYVTK